MIQNKFMNDPILYLSMFLGFGGVYVLISAFHDDDDDDSDDDGERYIFLLDTVWSYFLRNHKSYSSWKGQSKDI